MTINQLITELFAIINNENQLTLIPDIGLLKLWRLLPNIDTKDFIDEIKTQVLKGVRAGIKVKGVVVLQDSKEVSLGEIGLINSDRVILEIKGNYSDVWFFEDQKTGFQVDKKRNFMSFLNTNEENDHFLIEVTKNLIFIHLLILILLCFISLPRLKSLIYK